MSETGKLKPKELTRNTRDSWDHRFVFDRGDPVGTRSLPSIKAPKPYISKNGSVVKSVLRTKEKHDKRKKITRERGAHNCLEIITTSLTPKKHVVRTLPPKGSGKISALQQGKIKCLRSRTRPFSLPLLRDVQSPLPLGIEKSYSARDSSSRASMLKIDLSLLDVESSKEKKQWQDFKEITEDCEVNDLHHLTRLFCIGKGSSAYVYKSVLFPSLQVVADKVVVVASHEKSSQIIQELNSLRTLLDESEGEREHPRSKNIVRLLEVYPNPRDGTISLCLEYMAGGSLQDVLQSGGCQNELVLTGVCRQVMSGISYLHSHRHIHRDIKPGNILIGNGNFLEGEAVVKISDFGIAKELEKGHSLADSFLGTFHYMSPERIAGNDYSFSSDIWGCGLSILAVAMGCYPFSKHSESNVGGSQNLKSNRRRGKGEHQSKAEVKGGQDHGGYWHILQAISQRPSIKKLLGRNHTFSSQFSDFLSTCLHRDKDQRPSALFFLSSHPFLVGDTKQDSSSSLAGHVSSKETEEYFALREFVTQCCAVHREKLAQNLRSSVIFPTIKQKEYGKMVLHDANVVLTTDGDQCDDIDNLKYKCVRYKEEYIDDMNHLFIVISAYNAFVSSNWGCEEDIVKFRAVDVLGTPPIECRSNLPRSAALQYLLETTLSIASCEEMKSTDTRNMHEFTAISPSIAPLFDHLTFQSLSDQLHIPIYFVKICFRDFILNLLKSELHHDSHIEAGVSKTKDIAVTVGCGLHVSLPVADEQFRIISDDSTRSTHFCVEKGIASSTESEIDKTGQDPVTKKSEIVEGVMSEKDVCDQVSCNSDNSNESAAVKIGDVGATPSENEITNDCTIIHRRNECSDLLSANEEEEEEEEEEQDIYEDDFHIS